MSATVHPASAEITGSPARRELLDELAMAVSYPEPGTGARLAALALRLDAARAPGAVRIERFLRRTSTLEAGELEELYTRTFDLNPDATLDVGWHLHGETYERGNFLVMLRELERRHGIECSTELPDNLALVLRLVGRLPEPEAGPFFRANMEKALAAIVRVLEQQESPYADLVALIGDVLGGGEASTSASANTNTAESTEHGR